MAMTWQLGYPNRIGMLMIWMTCIGGPVMHCAHVQAVCGPHTYIIEVIIFPFHCIFL